MNFYPETDVCIPAEYDQWANITNGGNVAEEVISPCDVAANEHHTTDQTTCSRGSKMFENDTSVPSYGVPPCHAESKKTTNKTQIKRLTEIVSQGVAMVEISRHSLIDGKYLPPALVHDLMQTHGKPVLLLAAGLGVGKSTASAAMMQEHYDGKGVAMCHRIGLTHQLSKAFDADNYQDIKKTIGGVESVRLGTTIHSTPDMMRIDRSSKAFVDGLLVLDESNSAANEMLTSTIKNEAVVIQSIGQAIKQSKALVCADAHMDLSTVSLLQAAGVSTSDMLLIVVDRPELEDYTIRFFEDEVDDKGVPATRAAFINQIIADLRNGLKVIVTSLSAAFLDELDNAAEQQELPGRIKITRNTPMNIREALTAESYQKYELVMLSPAMSTGISFDGGEGYRHADRSYVVLSNCQDTGTYQDGLQAMMRERAVNNQTINVYYQESPVPLPPASRIAKTHQNHVDSVENFLKEHGLIEAWNQRRPGQDSAEVFMLGQALRFGEHKRDFKALFIDECKHKGAMVQACGVSELAEGDITYTVLQEEKARQREEWVQEVAEAIKVNPDEEIDPDDNLLKSALNRQYVEQQAVIDFDELELLERKEWIDRVLPAEGKSIITATREIERAYADKSLLTEIVKVALIGASAADDDRVQFMEKSSTSKVHWMNRAKYTRMLLQTAGVIDVSGELDAGHEVVLTEKAVKTPGNNAYPLFSSLIKNPKPAISSGFLSIETKPGDVQANPLPFIIDMLAGIGIKTRKKRGKNEWKVAPEQLGTTLGMVNRRKTSGMNQLQEWLNHVSEYLEGYQSRKSATDDRNASTRPQAPDNVVNALSEALDKAGKPELLEQAVVYFEPFHTRIKSRKLSPVAIGILVKKWLEKSPE